MGVNMRFWLYNLKRFIQNIITFRKQLWDYEPFDISYNYDLFGKSLRVTAKYIDNNGHLVNNEQVAKEINTAAKLCERIVAEDYMDNYLEHEFTGKGLFGIEWDKKDNVPYNYNKAFKMIDRQRDIDVKYLGKLLGRKSLTWWD